jgi:hypothetical protein
VPAPREHGTISGVIAVSQEVAVERRSPGRWTAGQALGILLTVVGGLYLVRNAGWFAVDWGLVWPILALTIGLWVVVGALRSRDSGTARYAVTRATEERLHVELRLGAGRFRMSSGADATTLVSVDSAQDDIAGTVRRDGRLARVRLSRNASWLFGGWRGAAEWRVALATDVPLRLDVAGGAGVFDIDRQDLHVTDASLAVGAAEVRLALPYPTGDVAVRVTAGASSVTIEIPPGVEAGVVTSGLLSVEGRTETPGYATSPNRVSVRVDGAAGSVRIRGTR